MSESTERSPEPLPFADLLAVLKARGLPIGMREHLVVARLISRWEDPSTESLCNSLAAVLARNKDEVKLVRDTFDQLYSPDATDYESLEMVRERGLARRPDVAKTISEPLQREKLGLRVRILRAARVQWIAWLAAAALLVSFAYLARSLSPSRQERELLHPQELPSRKEAPAPPREAPKPPVIDKTRWVPDRKLSLTVAAAAALLLFNWLYMVRAGQQAGRRGRRRWGDELDAMPGPQDYDLALSGLLKPSFSFALLDEVARILSRYSTSAARELDVDRTLERTFRAGLAPQLVWRLGKLSDPLVVLEDVDEEMEPFQPRVTALLEGLKARGVPMDRWQFDADAGRLFRASDKPGPSFEQLSRIRAGSPLLVISTGKGLRRRASRTPWLPILRRWKRRAWLHPAVDLRYWRPELKDLKDLEIDVWPMSSLGLLAVAKLLVRGFGPEPPDRTPAEHRVVPLDVDRLRWLLSLAPRRTPELAELLRQQFCPQVPAAALIEALEAPPLASSPGIGPSAPEVHAFLWDVLAKSRPPERSASYGRWRLDRALQALDIPGMEKPALAELRDLAKGPMALEVEHVLEPLAASNALPETLRQPLHGVLRQARRRAIRKGIVAGKSEFRTLLRRSLPTMGELATTIFIIGTLFVALPRFSKAFQNEKPVSVQWAYLLTVDDPKGTGPFTLQLELLKEFRREDVPDQIEIFRGSGPLGSSIRLDAQGRARRTLDDRDRGAWFHAEAELGEDILAVSNKELVGEKGRTGWLRISPLDEKGQILQSAVLILERGQEQLTGVGDTLIQLTTADWILRVSALGYKVVEQKVSVAARLRSAPTKVSIRLELVERRERTGWLRISPLDEKGQILQGAVLSLERGQKKLRGVGDTPIQLTAADWMLRVSAPGYEAVEQKVLVAASPRSAPTTVSIRLRVLPPFLIPSSGGGIEGGIQGGVVVPASLEPYTPPLPTVGNPGQNEGVTGPAPAESAPLLSPDEVREVVLSVLGKFENSDLHLEGHIPGEVLAKATKKVRLPAEEGVLGLVDVRRVKEIHPLIFGLMGVYYPLHKTAEHDPTHYISYEKLMNLRFKILKGSTIDLGNGDKFEVGGSEMNPEELVDILNTLAGELTERIAKKRSQ